LNPGPPSYDFGTKSGSCLAPRLVEILFIYTFQGTYCLFIFNILLTGKLNSRKGKNDLPGDLIYENRGLGSTGKVLIIIFTVTAVVLLVLIITAFYYKFKLKKLKIVYDQSRYIF